MNDQLQKSLSYAKILDEHHKDIFNLLHKLNKSVITSENSNNLYFSLQSLFDLWEKHFLLEEQYMKESEYPGIKLHKKEHRIFSDIIDECRQGIKNEKIILSNELIQFLLDWFNSHIFNEDLKYTQYLNNKNSL